jgi:hypothetical protein
MSSKKQLDGDSLRRQTAAAQDFCAKYDLELDTEFKLQDLGVSAYTGENLLTGDLGRFIQAVKDGTIEPGSWLIIESHDRFSRMTPQQALPYFLNVLNAGITIAVLSENQILRPDDRDPMKLLSVLIGMIRSHEESARKAEMGWMPLSPAGIVMCQTCVVEAQVKRGEGIHVEGYHYRR